MPHVTVRSKRTRLRIADIVISGVGDAGRTWHSAGSTARCGPTAVATLLRRFHPSGEMLEARHLHSNEHPVEGMFLQTFCSVPQGHRINACRRDGGVNTCEEGACYHRHPGEASLIVWSLHVTALLIGPALGGCRRLSEDGAGDPVPGRRAHPRRRDLRRESVDCAPHDGNPRPRKRALRIRRAP